MAFSNPVPPIPAVPFTPDLGQVLAPGANLPLVLFPVRLETRFFQSPDGAELRVRIYPDKIHVDTHEPELTDQEIIWGKHFWEQTWRASTDDEAAKVAWRQLVDRFEAPRAAWIAQALRPLNPDKRPDQPLRPDQTLPNSIAFPATATRADVWTRAPIARALPQRWYVLAYADGRLVLQAIGNPIRKDLHAGPDPSVSPDGIAEGDLAADDGMKWMVDFSEAETAGMGIRIRLNTDQAARGFDFLLVFGTAADSSIGTAELARLFDAHHYSDGLSFIAPGTPSNNTADAPSGFSSTDPGAEQSYASERLAASLKSGDGSNADVLAAAFGLRDQTTALFTNLANAGNTDQMDMRHMNRVLWPATWGYYLAQMMGGPSTPDDWTWARTHFIEYVRAAGPLPAVRAGRQPYAVLPITSLDSWKAKAGDEEQHSRDLQLRQLLINLRGMWRAKLTFVPRVGRTGDADRDFLDVLSMDASSSSYSMRHLMGEVYLRNLWSLLVPGDQKYWWLKQRELTKAGLVAAGWNWDPFLARTSYSGWYSRLRGPLVQADPVAEDTPLSPNYIDLLLNETSLENLQRETPGDAQPRSLLHSVLRHSMLLEYWMAALRLSGGGVNFEPEITGPGATAWDTLKRPVAGLPGDSAWNYLRSLNSPLPAGTPEAAARVTEFRDSLGYLKNLKAAKLQRLFTGTVDLCSYRLDAWISSFASKRLSEIRKVNPSATLVGGYGWVVNLQRALPPFVETPPAGEQGVFYRAANNPGFTHTPSLTQAATVAVLRSGHLTHANAVTKDLLSLDLSSERVRLAEWLLDGIRQGQPLGALLGYRFERRLQVAGQAYFIPFFREAAPLVANKREQTDKPVESIAANNVTDGLVLQRKWKASQNLTTLFAKRLPDAAKLQAAQTILMSELNVLADAVDAVSDALLAESVHHAVQGSLLRSASTLDSLATGETPPPELDLIRTPRTGTAITYRLAAAFSGAADLPAPWRIVGDFPRANAEPHLNAFAARLLGDPGRVRCVVERVDVQTQTVSETRELRLAELQLSPLDFIYATEGTRDGQPSEIEQQIIYRVARSTSGATGQTVLRLNPRRSTGWTAMDLSYGEFIELVRAARKLITASRGLDASDFAAPSQHQDSAVDLSDLQTRANDAEAALRKASGDLQAQLANPGADLELLRAASSRALAFGVVGGVPLSASGNSSSDRDLLNTQARALAAELSARLEKLTALAATPLPAAATIEQKRDRDIARLKTVFGNSFVVLPRFAAGNPAELSKAFADNGKILNDDSLALVTWFERSARVRDGVGRLRDSLRYAELVQAGEALNLKIAQLPYREADRWVGLPLNGTKTVSPSRFSLVVHSQKDLDPAQPLAALLIDEWLEMIPNASETTGLVFQYDQPDAAPPQSILVAVPPDPDQPWTTFSLQQVLLETLDLARIRAVDADILADTGHYLPAMYFAVNAAGETVSTDFAKLK